MRRLGDRAELDVVTTSSVKPISSNVRVHHRLTHASPKLLDLYRNADIFVMPARGECFGQVVPEAMACALPVVGCRVGATPELVIHGYNGLLVTPSDATGLFDALLRLVQDPYERRKMGQRSLHMARRDHDVDRNVGRLLEVIERVARRRGTAPRCQPISADEARDRVGVGVYSERTP
jgi:glycosyltransferase involved in cell wall biosynthesis